MTISKERLEQIEAIPDKEIDYTDIPQTDEAFWEKAELRMPQPKKGVYLRLDQDLLDWLKRQGRKSHALFLLSVLAVFFGLEAEPATREKCQCAQTPAAREQAIHRTSSREKRQPAPVSRTREPNRKWR